MPHCPESRLWIIRGKLKPCGRRGMLSLRAAELGLQAQGSGNTDPLDISWLSCFVTKDHKFFYSFTIMI